MTAANVVLGLGSNLGDRAAQLAAARRRLEETGALHVTGVSTIVESAPIGPPQPNYLNQVLLGKTELTPMALVARLKTLETELGRSAGAKWGPRTIDIDLVVYEGIVLQSQELTLPHPEIAAREFVLEPWAELDGAARVPGLERTVNELLADLRRDVNRAGRVISRHSRSTP